MQSLLIEGRNVVQPSYDYNAGRFVRFYKLALKDIQGELQKADITNMRAAQSYALQENIRERLRQLNTEAFEWANANIPNAAKNGVATSLVSLGLVGDLEEAKKIAHFNKPNEKLVAAAIADTHKDILAITKYMDDNVRKRIRDVAAIAIREKLVTGYGRRTIAKDMTRRILELQNELADSADVAIRDNANRVWKVEHYTEMLARTKLMNTHTDATTNDAVGRGALYATVSTNPRTKDACQWHEGRIVKLDPNAEGDFMTVDELKASGQIFHPNCKHHILPFRRFDRLSEAALANAKVQEAKGRSAMKLGGRKPDDADVHKGHTDLLKDFTVPKQQTQAKAIAAVAGAPRKETILEHFKAANTIKEANAWAAQHLPISHVDYKGYDVRLANAVNRQFAVLLDKYEKVRNVKYVATVQARYTDYYKFSLDEYVKRLRSLPSNDGFTDEQLMTHAKKKIKKRKSQGEIANAANHQWGAFEGICFNKEYASDYDKAAETMRRGVSSKWFPIGADEPTAIVTHEFGHMVDYYVQNNDMKLYNDEILPILNSARANGKEWVKDNLSQYSYTNNAEIIAESFSEYYHNPHPRKVATSVVEAVTKAYETIAKRG
jgi:hypothetical protein